MSVACKSVKARDEMLTFLTENYRSSYEVFEGVSARFHRSSNVPGTYFGYGHSVSKIGFDKPDPYEIAVLQWISFRAGKCRTFKGKGVPEAVPWLNLDGNESSVVIPPSLVGRYQNHAEHAWRLLDEHGWRTTFDRWWEDRQGNLMERLVGEVLAFSLRYDRDDKIIREEIHRLDKIWEKR